MFLSTKEMLLLCAFHSGTLSETLDSLRSGTETDSERVALIKNLTEKLESMKDGENVSLHFDPES